MNLQAKRISGSSFSAEDRLEVSFDSEGQDMHEVINTVELVSGVGVTHGGGAPSDEYLHYKSHTRDVNSDGIIDYSDVEIAVVQLEKGVSVIKVVAKAITKDVFDSFIVDYEDWLVRKTEADESGIDFTEEEPLLSSTTIKTGVITLEWTDDSFV